MLIQNDSAKMSGHFGACINMSMCVHVHIQWSKLLIAIFHCGDKSLFKEKVLRNSTDINFQRWIYLWHRTEFEQMNLKQ